MYFSPFWPNVLGFSVSILIALTLFSAILFIALWAVLWLDARHEEQKKRELLRDRVRRSEEYVQRRSFDV